MGLFDIFRSGEHLEDVVRRGKVSAARRLLEKGVANLDRDEGLYVAVHSRPEMVELLIEYGANVNHQSTRSGQTPLHLAAKYGYVDVAKCLLAHGARVDIRDPSGLTPLACTVQGPLDDAFLAAGVAPPKLRDYVRQGKNEVAALLRAYGATM